MNLESFASGLAALIGRPSSLFCLSPTARPPRRLSPDCRRREKSSPFRTFLGAGRGKERPSWEEVCERGFEGRASTGSCWFGDIGCYGAELRGGLESAGGCESSAGDRRNKFRPTTCKIRIAPISSIASSLRPAALFAQSDSSMPQGANFRPSPSNDFATA